MRQFLNIISFQMPRSGSRANFTPPASGGVDSGVHQTPRSIAIQHQESYIGRPVAPWDAMAEGLDIGGRVYKGHLVIDLSSGGKA